MNRVEDTCISDEISYSLAQIINATRAQTFRTKQAVVETVSAGGAHCSIKELIIKCA